MGGGVGATSGSGEWGWGQRWEVVAVSSGGRGSRKGGEGAEVLGTHRVHWQCNSNFPTKSSTVESRL